MDIRTLLELESKGKFDEIRQYLEQKLPLSLDESIVASRIQVYAGDLDEAMEILNEVPTILSADTFKVEVAKMVVLAHNWQYNEIKARVTRIDTLQITEQEGIRRESCLLRILDFIVGLKTGEKYSTTKPIDSLVKEISQDWDYYANLANYFLADIQRIMGDNKASMKLLTQLLKINTDSGNYFESARIRVSIGLIHASKSKYPQARDEFEGALLLLQSHNGSRLEIAKIFNNLGLMYRYMGQIDKTEEMYSLGNELAKAINNINVIKIISTNLALSQMDLGLYDEALYTYLDTLESIRNLGDNGMLATIYSSIALIYRKKGLYAKANEYLNKCAHLRETMHDKLGKAVALNGIGKGFLEQGDIQIAQGYLNEAYEILLGFSNEDKLASAERDLGLIQQKLDNPDKALEYFESSLRRRRDVGNPIEIAEILYYYIMAAIEKDGVDISNEMDELEKLSKNTQILSIKAKAISAQAELYRKQQSLSDHIKAMELEEQVLHLSTDNELRTLSMLNLCEFMLLELKVSEEEEQIQEIHILLDQLSMTAATQSSYQLWVQVMIIKSKLNIIIKKFDTAISMLQEALEIAESHNIMNLKRQVMYLLDNMTSEISKINASGSLISRLEMAGIESYVKQVAAVKSTLNSTHSNKDNNDEYSNHSAKELTTDLVGVVSANPQVPKEKIQQLLMSSLDRYEIHLLLSTYLMLDYITVDSKLNYRNIDIRTMVDDRVTYWSNSLPSAEIRVNVPDGIGRVDVSLMSRVLDNLIHNALKFTTAGRVEVSGQTTEDQIRLTIANSSPPIPEPALATLADKFTQYYEAPQKGLGIGLTFSKKVVELHGGTLTLHSPIPGTDEGFMVEISIPKRDHL